MLGYLIGFVYRHPMMGYNQMHNSSMYYSEIATTISTIHKVIMVIMIALVVTICL